LYAVIRKKEKAVSCLGRFCVLLNWVAFGLRTKNFF